MADAIDSAWVEIVPDFSDFKRTARKEMSDSLGDAGDAGGKEGSRRFGGAFSSGIRGLTGVVLAAVAALGIAGLIGSAVSEGFRSIDLASDLAETKSAISTVFGGAADDIVKFSETAAFALGQTQQQALEGAQTFGVFGKAAGLQDKPLSDFSTSLVTLAGDLASFYNTDPGEAIEALSAGLRGESEPLRRYGVLLDDATLKNKAFELGLISSTKDALTPANRVLAAQAAILEQTGVAQGDFAKTSSGLANQQRILAAAFEDSKTRLGEALLPAALGFVTFARNTLIPVFDEIVTAISPVLTAVGDKLTNAFQGSSELGLADVLDRISNSPVVMFFSDLLDILRPYIPTLTSLYNQFSPTAIAFQQLAPYMPQLADGFKQLVAGLAPLIPQFISLIPPLLQLIPPLVQLAVAVLPLLPPLISVLVVAVGAIVEGLKLWAQSTKGLFDGLELLFGMLTGTVALDDFIAGVRAIPGPLGGVLTVVTDAGTAFGNFFHTTGTGIRDFVGTVASGVGQIIGFFQQLPANIAGVIGGIANTLVTAGRDLIDGFIRGIRDGFERVKATLTTLTSFLPSWKGPASLDKVILRDSGRFVIDGFINGLQDRFPAIESTLGAVTSSISGFAGFPSTANATGLLASSSPSNQPSSGPINITAINPEPSVVARMVAQEIGSGLRFA